MASKSSRPDRSGTHRTAFDRNKKIIYATQTVCGICGKPVDFGMKYPHPLSPCIDHIIPVSKGGHPSDMENLQLAHWKCNREKSDRIPGEKEECDTKSGDPTRQKAAKKTDPEALKESLPWTVDWKKYKGA